MKTILLSGFAVADTIATFSLSIRDNSLKSLSAAAKLDAGVKCVQASNSDCLSSSTGNIYTGYRAGKIGG